MIKEDLQACKVNVQLTDMASDGSQGPRAWISEKTYK